MEHILACLVASVEEITGAYIYTLNREIIFNKMPPEFELNTLRQIGQTLAVNLDLAKVWFDDIIESSLHFVDSNITAKEIQEHSLLIVMFNPSINKQKLHMSLELALESLAEGNE